MSVITRGERLRGRWPGRTRVLRSLSTDSRKKNFISERDIRDSCHATRYPFICLPSNFLRHRNADFVTRVSRDDALLPIQ